MQEWVEEPFMVFLMVDGEEPSNAELHNENGDEVDIVSEEVSMQVRVVPIVKRREVIVNELVADINGEIPLKKNVEQVDDHEVDHQQVYDEKRGAAFVLEFRPIYFEHFTKLTALRISTLRPTNTVYHV